MKKLCVLLGVLFILPLVALPAKAASAEAGRKALCNWAKEHNLQASVAVSGACGEVGVELVANANVGSNPAQAQLAAQYYELLAQIEQLRAISQEKNEAKAAAMAARDAAQDALNAWKEANSNPCIYDQCNDPEGDALVQAVHDAQDAFDVACQDVWDAAGDVMYAEDEAHRIGVEAGLVEPYYCEVHPEDEAACGGK